MPYLRGFIEIRGASGIHELHIQGISSGERYLEDYARKDMTLPPFQSFQQTSLLLLQSQHATPASSAGQDRKAAHNEAEMVECGDVGEWLGADMGNRTQVVLPFLNRLHYVLCALAGTLLSMYSVRQKCRDMYGWEGQRRGSKVW